MAEYALDPGGGGSRGFRAGYQTMGTTITTLLGSVDADLLVIRWQ